MPDARHINVPSVLLPPRRSLSTWWIQVTSNAEPNRTARSERWQPYGNRALLKLALICRQRVCSTRCGADTRENQRSDRRKGSVQAVLLPRTARPQFCPVMEEIMKCHAESCSEECSARCGFSAVRHSWLLLVALVFCSCASITVANDVIEPSAELQEQIGQLISDLGAPEFQVREAAEEELSALGLNAYEALLDVKDHRDIEVRLRARHVLDELRGSFMLGGVADDVAAVIQDYHLRKVPQRQAVIDQLRGLLPQQGADALARIARFEETERLSRQAALAVLAQPVSRDATSTRLATSLLSGIGFSKRPAVQWLRAYAAACQGSEEVAEQWQQLIDAELNRKLKLEETEAFRREYVTELKKAAADVAIQSGNRSLAEELKNELTAALDQTAELTGWLEWLLDRSDWDSIVSFHDAHREIFESEPVLLYGLAEAQLALGDTDAADQTAARALDLNSQNPQIHNELAILLKSQRGLYPWAEAEYRRALDLSEPTNEAYYHASVWLAELLHDLDRDEEAAEIIDAALAKVDNDKMKLLAMHRIRSKPDMVSRASFFRVCHYRRSGEREKELSELKTAITRAEDDVDLLIAMFTVKNASEDWKQRASELVKTADLKYRKEVRQVYDAYENVRNRPDQREAVRLVLATSLNQYAWLVGNTEGDIDEAIRNSHKSLELAMGEGGYLDTLARCYYRAGKLDEALKYQELAVERAPFELQIQKQLTLIRQAVAVRDAAATVGSVPIQVDEIAESKSNEVTEPNFKEPRPANGESE